MLWMGIMEILQLAIILIISVWLHEYAHAYFSYKLGDPTPKMQWRLTTNPLVHIDPIWFLMIFLIWFGRGKPVQINPMNYKDPKKGELIVALAGPTTNILLAIGGVFLMLLFNKISGSSINNLYVDGLSSFFVGFFKSFASLNILLAIFNLLPIPPLDGFSFIKMYWAKAANFILKYQRYIQIIMLALLFMGPLRLFLSYIVNKIFYIFLAILGTIFY